MMCAWRDVTAWSSGGQYGVAAWGGAHGGHAEFKVAVYWRFWGICGGSGVCTVRVRGGTGEPYSAGAAGMHGGTGVSP